MRVSCVERQAGGVVVENEARSAASTASSRGASDRLPCPICSETFPVTNVDDLQVVRFTFIF